MRKLLLTLGVCGLMGAMWSCEDEPSNPGDFSLKAELALDSKMVSIGQLHPGVVYELTEAGRRDTIYKYEFKVNDTLFEFLPNGDSTYVYGPDGKPIVDVRDSFYLSKKTAELIEMNPIVFESYGDTLEFRLTSNARWLASAPKPDGAQWVYNYGSTSSGGGNSKVTINTTRNRQRLRGPVFQYVFTSDSLVCYKIPLYQKGERDK